jgi:hypothetical protein
MYYNNPTSIERNYLQKGVISQIHAENVKSGMFSVRSRNLKLFCKILSGVRGYGFWPSMAYFVYIYGLIAIFLTLGC